MHDTVGPARHAARALTSLLLATSVLAAGCALPPLAPDDPRQPALLARGIDGLAPQRPGVADVYLVAAALWASEDVFLREATMAREVFDRRVGTQGRSIVLANNRATADTLPYATVAQLSAAIQAAGARLDADEDVLAVFLTTHGLRNHRLVVDLGGDPKTGLSPAWLKHVLDRTGARWRIVILSACYTGGFVDAVADDRTLVVTAADAVNRSFGCGDGERYTFFGDAYLNQALRETGSLIDAFPLAERAIREREVRGRFPPSNPRFVLGEALRDKLRAIEARTAVSRPR
ncbi:MAG: C13 family peptidase [Lautropia sp.]